jgi:hypothetical protein
MSTSELVDRITAIIEEHLVCECRGQWAEDMHMTPASCWCDWAGCPDCHPNCPDPAATTSHEDT